MNPDNIVKASLTTIVIGSTAPVYCVNGKSLGVYVRLHLICMKVSLPALFQIRVQRKEEIGY